MSTREDREIDAREDAGWAALDARNEELECESCAATGEVQLNHGSINWDEPRWVVCPECDGTGRIDPDAFESEPWEPRC